MLILTMMTALGLLLSLFSCARGEITPFPGEAAGKNAVSSETNRSISIASEWERVLSGARKEGKVVVYSTNAPAVREALMQGFFSRTGINVEIVTGRGGELSAKLVTEQRNGLYLADVYLGGTTTALIDLKPKGVIAPLEPALFLPEVLDTGLWFKNTLPWVDKDKTIMQTRMMVGGSQVDIVFNTGLARKSEFVSWYDLLNPRFKGKLNLQDPTAAGKGGKFINQAITYYGLNWDYMRELAKLEPFITRDERMMLDWVARGKHVISVNPSSPIYEEFRTAGAPVEGAVFRETRDVLGGGVSGVSLIKNAPHPLASKLFINWFLSKEGQTSFARSYGIQSGREDVPTDHLLPEKIRKPGIDYPVETEDFVLQEEKFRPIVVEIFGPLLAR